MGWNVQFESGQSVSFEKEPTQKDIEEAEQALGLSKKGALWSDVPKIGLQQGLDITDLAWTLPTAGLREIARKIVPSIGEEGTNQLFAELDRRTKERQQYFNPENKQLSAVQQAAATGLTIPLQLGPSILGSGPQRMKEMIDVGESVPSALKAGAVDTALAGASVAIPGAAATRAGTIALGAGGNVGTGVASDIAATYFAETPEGETQFHPFGEEGQKRRIVESLVGITLGAATKPRGQSVEAPPDTKGILTQHEAAKKGGPFWRGEGDVINPEPLTPGRLPPIQTEGLPPDVPPITRGEPPLPDLNTIQDHVPLLPDTPIAREGVTGETPLPTIDPRLAARDLMDTPDLPPMGLPRRDSRGDMHNMAEGMETVDFPLRQEVLDSPEIKQAIDNFRVEAQRLIDEGNQAGLDQLTRDFTAGMQRLGIARPQDAFGRGLYEGGEQARYLETGIQRSGDRNTNLATMPETKQLPLGGKQPKPEEVSRFRKAIDDWKAWRDENARKGLHKSKRGQSGKIDQDLLGIGAVSGLIKRLGSKATIEKFKGTFNPENLARAIRTAQDPNNRETLVWLSPDEFHKLATKRHPTYMEQAGVPETGIERKRGSIRTGLESDEGLVDIPYLWLTVDPNNPLRAEVVGHEGRHRADIFKEKEVDRYPVRLILSSGEGVWKDHRFAAIRSEDNQHILPFPSKVFEDKPRVPKSQRGAIDIKAISDGIDSLIAKVKKGLPKSEEGVRADVVGKAVGWKQNYIAEVPEVTPEFLEKVKSEPNTTNIFSRALGPGRVAVQELQGRTNELIAFAGRHLENARNRYEILKDEVVEPLKRVMRPVIQSKAQLESLTEVFTRELHNGQRYSDDVLRQALSPKGYEAYKALRDGLDRARDIINEVRKSKGLKEITMLEAYMGSMWLGPWKAHVYDANKKLVWVIAEPSAYSRAQAIDYLRSHDPSLKFTELKYDASMGRAKDNLDAAYTDLINLLGKDDLVTQTIGELLSKRYLGQTMNIGGVEQHFKRKTGVGGFAGNRPWIYRFKDRQALFEQQVRYIDNVIRWGEQQKVLAKIDEVIKDPEVAEARIPDIQYIQELIRAEQGRDISKVMSGIEDWVAETTKISPRHYMQGLGMAKAYFYMHKLGLSLPFMMTSILQPMLAVPPALIAHGAKFGEGTLGLLLDGYRMAADIGVVDFASLKGAEAEAFAKSVMEWRMSDLSKEAVNYALANRVVELNQLTDISDIAKNKYLDTAEKAVGWTITMPEMIARSNAFMAFVHGLKHKYDTSTHEGRLALFEKAGEITKEIMGDYNPAQKAMIYQRFGMVGNAASALQTFMMNHMYQTYKYAKMAAKGDPAPFLMQTALQITFAGATGLIGVEDAEDLVQFLKQWMPHDMYVEWKDFSVKETIANLLGKDAYIKDPWAYGLVSTITGKNLYTRFSTSDMLRIFPAEPSLGAAVDGFIPYISDTIKQMGSVLTLLGAPTGMRRAEAANALIPTALKGVYEEQFRRGEDVIPRMGEQEYAQVRRSPEDATARMLGFKPLNEQKQMDAVYARRGMEIAMEAKEKKVRESFVEGVVGRNPEEITIAIKKAVDLGIDPTPWMSDRSFQQIYINAYLPIAERELYILGKKKNLSPKDAEKFKIWRKIYELNR